MGRKLFAMCGALPVAVFAGSACAMDTGATGGVRCSVQRAELLPAGVGGAATVCTEVRQALSRAGRDPAEVTITVLSSNQLSAIITNKQGRKLPELRFAKSDRPLSRASVGRFARSIAEAAGQ
jgi:hypothetical protein